MNPKRRLSFLALLIFANLITVMPAAAQPDSIYQLAAGTRIRLKLDAEINSDVSSVNDTFIAFVAEPVAVRGTIVVPEGTQIEGRVTKVSRSSNGGQPGSLDVVFETLKIGATTRSIDGVMRPGARAGSSRTFNALSILGGIAAGALVGGVSGNGRGALIGAGIGAGAGTGIALLRKGKNARLRKGEEFEIELRREVVLPPVGY
jgi:hypothetical protein